MNIKGCWYVMLLFVSCIIGVAPVQAATITATVDRNPVSLDESFRLVLTIKGSASGEPELDVLNKDFDIIGRSQSSNFQITNGSMSRQSQFFITLIPKREGTLLIPAVRIGDDSSQAIKMTVVKAATATQKNADISLDVSADKKEVSLQEQLIVTARLSLSVGLANASLSSLKVDGGEAMIEKLGDDSEFETQRNGIRVRVIERRYAVFPQKSGDLIIGPVLFNGQIVQASSRLSNNPLYQNVRSKRLRSEPIKINVSAIPATQAGEPWLPARKLTLTESWPETPPVFRAGEAITRTLTITADGLMAAQLPDVSITMPADIKHYADKPVMNDQHKGSGIIGTRQQKIAIIPAQAGLYTLPAIKLQWWNTAKRRSETLRLPSRKIEVLAAEISSATTDSLLIGANLSGQKDAEVPTALASSVLKGVAQAGLWPWLSLALLLAWLATFFIMRSRTLRTPAEPTFNESSEVSLSKKKAIRKIKQACQANDPQATKQALLLWAGLHFDDSSITSLADVAVLSDALMSAAVTALNHALYSQGVSGWDGKALLQAVDAIGPGLKSKQKSSQALAPLYP